MCSRRKCRRSHKWKGYFIHGIWAPDWPSLGVDTPYLNGGRALGGNAEILTGDLALHPWHVGSSLAVDTPLLDGGSSPGGKKISQVATLYSYMSCEL